MKISDGGVAEWRSGGVAEWRSGGVGDYVGAGSGVNQDGAESLFGSVTEGAECLGA
jgi:hypothetical protein